MQDVTASVEVSTSAKQHLIPDAESYRIGSFCCVGTTVLPENAAVACNENEPEWDSYSQPVVLMSASERATIGCSILRSAASHNIISLNTLRHDTKSGLRPAADRYLRDAGY
jgi:hypothetical protein